MKVSILICTRNRADSLRETMRSIGTVEVPTDLPTELLVVDNGSTDHTRQVVEEARLSNMAVRYVLEPQPGQCHARNTALTAARGDIIVFTDDDVRFPPDWLEQMSTPILTGKADAVAGSVRMAPHLLRSWMRPVHVSCFAWDFSQTHSPHIMVGAAMAFSRRVLDKVPGFDVDLGPGKLGFSDDVLFAYMVEAAGYRIVSAGDCFVEHHFDPDRLSRAAMLDRAAREGRCKAYLHHHWLRSDVRWLRIRYAVHMTRLRAMRLVRRPEMQAAEGCPEWEWDLVNRLAATRYLIDCQRQPRKYPAATSSGFHHLAQAVAP